MTAAEVFEGLPLLLSTQRAAEVLDVTSKTVREWILAGRIRAERHGRVHKIPLVEVERLAGRRLGPSDEDRRRRELYLELQSLHAREGTIIAEVARLEV